MINPESEQNRARENIQPFLGCGRYQGIAACIGDSFTGLFVFCFSHDFFGVNYPAAIGFRISA